jgi:hypothetical protein
MRSTRHSYPSVSQDGQIPASLFKTSLRAWQAKYKSQRAASAQNDQANQNGAQGAIENDVDATARAID